MKYKKYVLMLALFGLAIICLGVTSHNAEAATRSWTALGADNSAATAGNWDVLPVTGDSATIGYDSRGITWNINSATTVLVNVWCNGSAAAAGNMVITETLNTRITGSMTVQSAHATYTVSWVTSTKTLTAPTILIGIRGIMTQGAAGNIMTSSLTQTGTGSTINGVSTAWIYNTGNATFNIGVTNIGIQMQFNGTGKTFTRYDDNTISVLKITGSITSQGTGGHFTYTLINNGILTLATAGSTFTQYSTSAAQTYTNTGTINGPGTMRIWIYSISDPGITFGNINAPVEIGTQSGVSSNVILSMNTDGIINSTLKVTDAYSANTVTLNIKGHSLTVTGLVSLNTRGIISSSLTNGNLIFNGGMTETANARLNLTNIPTVSCTGSWDTHLGVFTSGTSAVITHGSGTTWLATGQSFWNLDTGLGATRVMLSDVWVRNHYGNNGSWFLVPPQNWHLNISSNIPTPCDLYSGTFGSIYLNGTAVAYRVNFVMLPTGYVYAKASVTYAGPSTSITVWAIGQTNYVGTKVLTGSFPAKYSYDISYPVASQNMLFTVTGLKSMNIYNVTVNGIYNSQVQANYTGIAQYVINGVWTSNTLVSLDQVVPVVPVVVPGPDYTSMVMVLIFLALVTLFNTFGYLRHIGLIQLISIAVMMIGIVWAFLIMPSFALIPFLFVIVNMVLFLMTMAGGRK